MDCQRNGGRPVLKLQQSFRRREVSFKGAIQFSEASMT